MTGAAAARVDDREVERRPQAAPPVGLYVHVPFCVSLCPYCDFVVYAGSAARGRRSRVSHFLAAVRREIELRADALDARFGAPGTERAPLGSVYLGGGTPSLLPADAIAELLDLVRARFGLADAAEVTIEANPGPAERGEASGLATAGVTRLSLGAQRLDAAELRALGRRHSPEDVEAAVALAREAGIGSIGLDLLYDIPGDTRTAWRATLERALALDPDHLSLYALTLDDPEADGFAGPAGDHLPIAPGARRWRERARPRQSEDRAADAYEHAVGRLAAAGYRGYEISNWARPGHESRHNQVYWERRPWEAVGPGAHAFDGVVRRWNAASLDAYLAALAPQATGRRRAVLPPGNEERLEGTTAAAEAVVLALRTDRGVTVAAGARPPLAPHVGWARDLGLLEPTLDDRLVLTTRGRLLSNELFARLV